MGNKSRSKPQESLPLYPNGDEIINTIIDTPKGSHSKYKYVEEAGLFKLEHILPDEMSFPWNFGYLPSTLGEDGDPLDVIVLMDEPVFTGCMLEARLVGAIEAEQTEDGRCFRNDRMIAVWSKSEEYSTIQTLNQLPDHLVDEMSKFFVTYEEKRGKQYKILGAFGRFRATQLVAAGVDQRKKAKNKT